MRKNRMLLLLVCVLTAFAMTACGTTAGNEKPESAVPEGENPPPAVQDNDSEIIEAIVENFALLAKVPRPSHHEEKISEFLYNWASEQGFQPVRDEANNIMFEVPASEGFEDYPLCILQGHMDMVAAVQDGKEFNALTDPITIIRDLEANTLTADGTALGGDDGAGVAIIMAVSQGKMNHGPLRVLITTDEEDGMEGAFNLDASWLQGAGYLINIDNEASNEVLVSTAAGDSVRISGAPERREPAGNMALNISLSGLTGGHSGVEIDKGRLNGLVGLANFLKEMEGSGLDFELAAFEGGTALNAIPAKATSTIVIDGRDFADVEALAETYFGRLRQEYAGIEDGMSYDIKEAGPLPQVVTAGEKENALRFITEVIDGVNTWSADMEGLVESSSNLGIFNLNADGVSGGTYIRSSVGKLETEILNSQLELAKSCGYQTDSVKMADPWPYDPDSRLLKLTKDIYREQNSEEITVAAVHAGLECGTFKLLNPEMDMISIGPDISDAHTVRETLYLNSIPKVWNLLEELLAGIGQTMG